MKAKYIIQIKFSKKGLLRYISHLDLLRLFRRAASRAQLPLENTCGFNPHPKISILKALKLGQEAEDLDCQFGLKVKIEPFKFQCELQKQLPEGIKITETSLL